ncbi:hypothetical protein JX266_013981 [Neoarthrinium moseri]|nr:hypothetical protein JX266_013981 [Neoarthrinium moseri]
MNTYMPVSEGFIRLAGYWVDDALGFLAGWNFYIYEALLIPFEVTALVLILSFWNSSITDAGPTAGICVSVIIAYFVINVFAVRLYGETEFWLSGGKLILILILFSFTFITMIGGNPHHDAYGFRYWQFPGAFAEYRSNGALGRFEGFLSCLWTAAFTIAGPEYISMVAAEAQRPSLYIKTAFKTVYYRFYLFFSIGALAVGIVVPYNDSTLIDIYRGTGTSGSTATASPYVVAMNNMGVTVLPHIVNALVLTSIFSAGNSYTYCATRSLHGLALEGRAPRFLRYCTRQGVPIYCLAITMLFPLLSLLQLSNGSAKVLNLLVNLITGGGLVTFLIISITFLNYLRACRVQGVDRKSRPYYGYFQPYGTYIAMASQFFIAIMYGYTAFSPFTPAGFFSNYTMQLAAIPLFLFWKLFKRTKYVKPEKVDLVWERPFIDAYERSLTTPPSTFWGEMVDMVWWKNKRRG